MVNNVSYAGNYQLPNINKENVQQTISKSSEVVSDKVESNALVSSTMGIDKESVFLAVPLIALIKFINNHLMSGDESKSLVGKMAKGGDYLSDFLKLDTLGSNIKTRSANFKTKHPKIASTFSRFKKYFGDDYKAIPKSSFARTTKMSEKYADALNEVLGTKIDNIDDLVKAADDVLSKEGIKHRGQISGLRNMLKAADSQIGKTGFGKFTAKAGLKAKEIVFSTSDFLGKSKSALAMDLFSIILFAGVLKRATTESKDAPKGEKLSTFMHVLSEDYAPLMVMQPATSLLYKIGGNKYRGMSVEQRKKVADIVSSANSKKVVNSLDGIAADAVDKVITKDALRVANLQKKMLMKGASIADVDSLAGKTFKEAKKATKGFAKKLDLKFWEKPLRFMGKILDTGLDTVKSPTIAGKLKNKAKGFAGGFGRLILIMFVLSSALQKPITKLCHKLFGEPKSYLAKQKAEEEKANATEQPTQNATTNNNGETNLVKIHSNQNNEKQSPALETQQQDAVATTEIAPQVDEQQPSQQEEVAALNLNKDKKQERYIPSTQVDFSHEAQAEKELNARVDQLLKETDYISKQAKKYKG